MEADLNAVIEAFKMLHGDKEISRFFFRNLERVSRRLISGSLDNSPLDLSGVRLHKTLNDALIRAVAEGFDNMNPGLVKGILADGFTRAELRVNVAGIHLKRLVDAAASGTHHDAENLIGIVSRRDFGGVAQRVELDARFRTELTNKSYSHFFLLSVSGLSRGTTATTRRNCFDRFDGFGGLLLGGFNRFGGLGRISFSLCGRCCGLLDLVGHGIANRRAVNDAIELSNLLD